MRSTSTPTELAAAPAWRGRAWVGRALRTTVARALRATLALSVLFVGIGASTGAAEDRGPVVRRCSITNGQVVHCGGWHQGEAVLRRNGAFRRCKVTNGRTTSCGPWYQGTVVARHDRAYRKCKVVNGQISSCGGWYQGDAVIDRPK
jgi:hypothetical protein